MPKRIVVPPGTVHSRETTVIEIPSDVEDEPCLLAIEKTRNKSRGSRCRGGAGSKMSYPRNDFPCGEEDSSSASLQVLGMSQMDSALYDTDESLGLLPEDNECRCGSMDQSSLGVMSQMNTFGSAGRSSLGVMSPGSTFGSAGRSSLGIMSPQSTFGSAGQSSLGMMSHGSSFGSAAEGSRRGPCPVRGSPPGPRGNVSQGPPRGSGPSSTCYPPGTRITRTTSNTRIEETPDGQRSQGPHTFSRQGGSSFDCGSPPSFGGNAVTSTPMQPGFGGRSPARSSRLEETSRMSGSSRQTTRRSETYVVGDNQNATYNVPSPQAPHPAPCFQPQDDQQFYDESGYGTDEGYHTSSRPSSYGGYDSYGTGSSYQRTPGRPPSAQKCPDQGRINNATYTVPPRARDATYTVSPRARDATYTVPPRAMNQTYSVDPMSNYSDFYTDYSSDSYPTWPSSFSQDSPSPCRPQRTAAPPGGGSPPGGPGAGVVTAFESSRGSSQGGSPRPCGPPPTPSRRETQRTTTESFTVQPSPQRSQSPCPQQQRPRRQSPTCPQPSTSPSRPRCPTPPPCPPANPCEDSSASSSSGVDIDATLSALENQEREMIAEDLRTLHEARRRLAYDVSRIGKMDESGCPQ